MKIVSLLSKLLLLIDENNTTDPEQLLSKKTLSTKYLHMHLEMGLRSAVFLKQCTKACERKAQKLNSISAGQKNERSSRYCFSVLRWEG